MEPYIEVVGTRFSLAADRWKPFSHRPGFIRNVLAATAEMLPLNCLLQCGNARQHWIPVCAGSLSPT